LDDYLENDTYLSYETDHVTIEYSVKDRHFNVSVNKSKRWKYHRPKIAYIPSERNLVAVIPGWNNLNMSKFLIDFMNDWDVARKSKMDEEILNLGVRYSYDAKRNADSVRLTDGKEIDFMGASSGLQSLIPILVYLSHFSYRNGKNKTKKSVRFEQEKANFINRYLSEYFGVEKIYVEAGVEPDYKMLIKDEKAREKFESIVKSFFENQHCEIFLEEPEDNLFPPTQALLVDWMSRMSKGPHGNKFFISSHSPYVLTALLSENIKFNLFLTDKYGGKVKVKTASDEDLQRIYENGIDAFFNLSSLAIG